MGGTFLTLGLIYNIGFQVMFFENKDSVLCLTEKHVRMQECIVFTNHNLKLLDV